MQGNCVTTEVPEITRTPLNSFQSLSLRRGGFSLIRTLLGQKSVLISKGVLISGVERYANIWYFEHQDVFCFFILRVQIKFGSIIRPYSVP